jgi:hypothetical protein
MDAVERELEYEFSQKGYSFVGGTSSPLRGPFIWKDTEQKTYEVEIPNGIQEVNVYFLSGFIMNSWHKYATFGEKQLDGWTKPDGIYYILKENEEIDDTSIDFHIWFLKHEAQHLYDYKNYPMLNSYELEYRAKLVELIYHPDIKLYIKKLYHQAKDQASLPHPYSAFMILDKMCTKLEVNDTFGWWESFNETELNQIAQKLFKASNKILVYK